MTPGRLAGRNLLLLLVLGALWGTAFMFITLGLPSFSPLLFAAYRFDIAGALLLLVALARKSPLWPRSRAQWTAISIAAVLNVGMYHALLFWGQNYTSPAIAAVIVGLNPILTTVLSRALLSDERVGWHGAVGLGLGMAGILILATLKQGSLLDVQGIAELAIVGAVFAWGLGSILVRRTRHGMDTFSFTAWQMLAGAALLHASSLLLEDGGYALWNGASILSLLYLAIVSSALGFVIYFTLLERVGPIRSNLVSHVAPIFAAASSFVFLGVAFEPRAVLAFVFIAGGFGLVARPAPTRAAAPGSTSGGR